MPELKSHQNIGIHQYCNATMDARLRCQLSEQRIFHQQHQLFPCLQHLLACLLLGFASLQEQSGPRFSISWNERGRKK